MSDSKYPAWSWMISQSSGEDGSISTDCATGMDGTALTLMRRPGIASMASVYPNRALFQDKVVLEIGAGAGLAGFVASQFASRTAITDGNDVVLRLLDQNADQASTPCGVFKLLWGEEDSVVQFQKDFPHPIDILLGADVVCWPNLVLPLLRTIK
ncbi:hypothetical protein DYB37_012179, partial [Aphanomyces astaci]